MVLGAGASSRTTAAVASDPDPADEDGAGYISDVDDDSFSRLSSSAPGGLSSRLAFDASSASRWEHFSAQTWDFTRAITAITMVYRRGIYIKMMSLDGEQWERVGRGSTFCVSRSEISFDVVSARNMAIRERVSNKLILKRNSQIGAKLTADQIRRFVCELRVLDHFHSHPFIVDLRGVGWFSEFCQDREPCPKPGILLEEAHNTLDYLIGPEVALGWSDMLRILAQISLALYALHSAGIAHGDVKPANVLIFKSIAITEGVQIESYTAKLSDFEAAVVDAGAPQPFPPGTKGYSSPETDAAIKAEQNATSFDAILRTDVWSLGILAGVLVSNSMGVLDASSSSHYNDRVTPIYTRVNKRLEESSAESSVAKDMQDVFKYTLAKDPSCRRLNRVVETLEPYLEEQEVVKCSSHSTPSNFDPYLTGEVRISYENCKHLSGNIKDILVAELRRLAVSDDLRQTHALWELGVIYISHFADPDSSTAEGLQYIKQAAEAGDCRAQALCYRLHDTFLSERAPRMPHEDHILLLEQAASAGHQSALEDLWTFDTSAATRVQAAYAAGFYNPLLVDDIESLPLGAVTSDNGDTALHRAAATGRGDHIRKILSRDFSAIDAQNSDGETSLMSACRFGQLEAATCLLEEGADVHACNKYGENCLHYTWNFSPEESNVIVKSLLNRQCSLRAVSRRITPSSDLDLLPVLPGTPLERAVGRRRLDLVLLFRAHLETIVPSNGRLARKLLIWALRLHDIPLQELLLDYTICDESNSDATLIPVIETKWLHKGQKRTLLDATCAGWVSGSSVGYDVPLRFWLACSHGKDWKVALQKSMAKVLELEHRSSPGSEDLLIDAINWTFDERHHDAFITALHMIVEWTPHTESMGDFDTLRWYLEDGNVCVMRQQLVFFIDQLLHDGTGTLAQSAFLSGDRYMFQLLTKKYHANPALPATMPKTKRSRIDLATCGRSGEATNLLSTDINLYSLFAYADHRDFWFVKQLCQMGLSLSCPWDTLPLHVQTGPLRSTHYIYITPLMHAIGVQFWTYAEWLLASGASVEEKVSADHNVLGAIMATRSVDAMGFFFRGCHDRDKGAAYVPSRYREAGGYFVFRLFYDVRNLMLTVHDDPDRISDMELSRILEGAELDKELSRRRKSQQSRVNKCFRYLLRKYPEAENSPLRHQSVGRYFTYHHLPMIHQAAGLSRADNDADILIMLARHWAAQQHPFPKQSVTNYLYSSPLDRFHGSQIREIGTLRTFHNQITLRHLAPSILWKRNLTRWYYILIPILVSSFFLWLIGPIDSWTLDNQWYSFFILLVAVACFVSSLSVYAKAYDKDLKYVSHSDQPFHRVAVAVLLGTNAPYLAMIGFTTKFLVSACMVKSNAGYWFFPGF